MRLYSLQHKKNRLIVYVGVLFGVLAVVGVGGWAYLHRAKPLISHSIAIKAGFPLYIPNKRNPASFDATSVQFVDNSVVTYNLTTADGKVIAVSLEKKPSDFDPNGTVQTPIKLPTYQKEFTTTVGKARFDVWGDKHVISLVTSDGTWIVLNVTGIDQDLAQRVAESLTHL